MKYSLFVLSWILLFSACNSREPIPLSEAQKKAMVDSIVRERTIEIEELERERLRDLMSLELKVRTDSLLAMKRPATVVSFPDTRVPVSPTKDSSTTQPEAESVDSSTHSNEVK